MNGDERQGSRRIGSADGLSHVRRRLAGILERMGDGLCAYDAEWRIVYLNPQGEAFLQRTADELLGRVVWEVFPEAVGSRVWHEYHRAQAEQLPSSFEEHAPEFGRWFEQHLFPSPDGLTVWARDVTQRHVDEERRARELLQSEQRFRALIENSSDAVMTARGRRHHPLREPVGRARRRAQAGGPRRQERDRLLRTPTTSSACGRTSHGWSRRRTSAVTGQQRFRHADGSWIWIEAVGQNLLHDPAIGAIVINFRDVTQRREAADAYIAAKRALERSERYYRALIDNGTDLISLVDASGVIRYASPSHERVLGWASDELVGRSAFDFVHEEDRQQVLDRFERATQPGSDGGSALFRYRHRDGSWRLLEATGTPRRPKPDCPASSSTAAT